MPPPSWVNCYKSLSTTFAAIVLVNYQHFITNLQFQCTREMYLLFYLRFLVHPFAYLKLFSCLTTLYAQSRRLTLTTHVLPRLLAHVLAIASHWGLSHFVSPRCAFTTTIVFFNTIILLGHACAHCPKFLTAVTWTGSFTYPRVADPSLKSAKYCRLRATRIISNLGLILYTIFYLTKPVKIKFTQNINSMGTRLFKLFKTVRNKITYTTHHDATIIGL